MLRGSSSVEAVSSVLDPAVQLHWTSEGASLLIFHVTAVEAGTGGGQPTGRHWAPCTKCSHNWGLPLLHPIGYYLQPSLREEGTEKECTLEPGPWQSGGHVCKAAIGSKKAEVLAVCSVSKITQAKRVHLLLFLSSTFLKILRQGLTLM